MVEIISFSEKKKFPSNRKNFVGCEGKLAQMKIQQMAFMIVGVFFFFILVGLFFISIYLGGIREKADSLERDSVISSLKVISNMMELNCDSGDEFCVDEDKLKIMASGFASNYTDILPVASLRVFKVYPSFTREIKCPAVDCNYFDIYDSGQSNKKEYSTFISICKKVKEQGYVYDRCEIGKLVAGIRINEQ